MVEPCDSGLIEATYMILNIEPSESDFTEYDGADRSMARFDRVTYMDVITHALPHLVLQSLRDEGLLEVERRATRGPGLRLLSINRDGGASILTFEDLAE